MLGRKKFLISAFIIVLVLVSVFAFFIWSSTRLESKFIFENDIKESYKQDLIHYFNESPNYDKNQFKVLAVSNLGVGNCSNIKGRERLEVKVEGYSADTVYRVFILNNKGVMQLCSSSNVLDTVFHVVE